MKALAKYVNVECWAHQCGNGNYQTMMEMEGTMFAQLMRIKFRKFALFATFKLLLCQRAAHSFQFTQFFFILTIWLCLLFPFIFLVTHAYPYRMLSAAPSATLSPPTLSLLFALLILRPTNFLPIPSPLHVFLPFLLRFSAH